MSRLDALKLGTALARGVLWADSITTADTEAPFGPSSLSGTVAARTDVGTFTITFPTSDRPRELLFRMAQPDDPSLKARITGYDASTGVLTLVVYDTTVTFDDPAYVMTDAEADSEDVVVNLFCVFRL